MALLGDGGLSHQGGLLSMYANPYYRGKGGWYHPLDGLLGVSMGDYEIVANETNFQPDYSAYAQLDPLPEYPGLQKSMYMPAVTSYAAIANMEPGSFKDNFKNFPQKALTTESWSWMFHKEVSGVAMHFGDSPYGTNPTAFKVEKVNGDAVWESTPHEAHWMLNKCHATDFTPDGGLTHPACSDKFNYRPRAHDGSHLTLGNNEGNVHNQTEMWILIVEGVSTRVGHARMAAMELALEYVNNLTTSGLSFPNLRQNNVTLNMVLSDNPASDAGLAIYKSLARVPQKTFAIFGNSGIDGGIGNVNECVRLLSAARLSGFPMFTSNCVHSDFEDSAQYPNLYRGVVKQAVVIPFAYQLLRDLGVRRLGFLRDPNKDSDLSPLLDLFENDNKDLPSSFRWNVLYQGEVMMGDPLPGEAKIFQKNFQYYPRQMIQMDDALEEMSELQLRVVGLAGGADLITFFLCKAFDSHFRHFEKRKFGGKHLFFGLYSTFASGTVTEQSVNHYCPTRYIFSSLEGQFVGIGPSGWQLGTNEKDKDHGLLSGVTVDDIRKRFVQRVGNVCTGEHYGSVMDGVGTKDDDCLSDAFAPQTFDSALVMAKALDGMFADGFVPNDFTNDETNGNANNRTLSQMLFEKSRALQFFGASGDVATSYAGERETGFQVFQFVESPMLEELRVRQPHNPENIKASMGKPYSDWLDNNGTVLVYPGYPTIFYRAPPLIPTQVAVQDKATKKLRWDLPLLLRDNVGVPVNLTAAVTKLKSLNMKELTQKLETIDADSSKTLAEKEAGKVAWVRENHFRDRPIDCTGEPNTEAVIKLESDWFVDGRAAYWYFTGEEICQHCKKKSALELHGYALSETDVPRIFDYNAFNLPKCVKTARGYYSKDGIATACPPGAQCPGEGAKEFTKCTNGTFQPRPAAESCEPCLAGTAITSFGELGALSCKTCQIGSYADGPGDLTCEFCPAGLTTRNAASTSSSDCMCPAGTYNPCLGVLGDLHTARLFNDTANVTYTEPLNFTGYEAVCSTQSWQSQFDDAWQTSPCVPCPRGMQCHGGALAINEEMFDIMRSGEGNFLNVYRQHVADPETITADTMFCKNHKDPQNEELKGKNFKCVHMPPIPEAGFWAPQSSSYRAFDCYYDGRCPGYGFGRCGENWGGFVCGECPSDYLVEADADGNKKAQCAKCGSSDGLLGVPLFTLLGLAAGLTVYRLSVFNRQLAGRTAIATGFGMMVNSFQNMIILETLELEWPDPFGSILEDLQVFAFDPALLRMGCLVGGKPHLQSVVRLAMPALWAIGVFISSKAVTSFPVSKVRDSFGGKFSIDAAIASVGLVYMALFIPLCVSIVSMFRCYSHPRGKSEAAVSQNGESSEWEMDVSSLVAYPDILCNSSDHGFLLMIGYIAVVGYILIPMAYLTTVIYRTQKDPASFNAKRWYFLAGRFGISCMQWVLYSCVRNAVMTFIPVFVGPGNPALKLTLFSTWCTLWACGILYIMPWRIYFLNLLDGFTLWGLAICSAWGFLYLETLEETNDVTVAVTMFIVGSSFLGIVLFILLFVISEFDKEFGLTRKLSADGALSSAVTKKVGSDKLGSGKLGSGNLGSIGLGKITGSAIENARRVRPEFGDPAYEEEKRIRAELKRVQQKNVEMLDDGQKDFLGETHRRSKRSSQGSDHAEAAAGGPEQSSRDDQEKVINNRTQNDASADDTKGNKKAKDTKGNKKADEKVQAKKETEEVAAQPSDVEVMMD